VIQQVEFRDVISVFSRGATILTDFLGRGAKYEKNKMLCVKTQKITIFKNQGGGANAPLPPPPQMTPLVECT